MKPQNVNACAIPGTVHLSSLRCPITSVASRLRVPARVRPHRLDPLRRRLPGPSHPVQPPQPPARQRDRHRRQDQPDHDPHNHEDLLASPGRRPGAAPGASVRRARARLMIMLAGRGVSLSYLSVT